MAFVIPMGLDSADGVTELPASPVGGGGSPTIVGTPLPTGQYNVFTSKGQNQPFVEEMTGSPKAERAEQCTCEHSLDMDKASAIFYFDNMPRGLVVTDTAGNIWRILSCDYERNSDLHTTFHYVMESISFDTPPDDFSCTPVQLDINIIKHPRYWRYLCPYAGDTTTISVGDTAHVSIAEIKECIIRMIQNYIESPFYPSQNQTNSLIQVNIINGIQQGIFQAHFPNPTFDASKKIVDPVVWDGNAASIPGLGNPNCAYYLVPIAPTSYASDNPQTGPIHLALAAAQELISKLWRQEDTPYLIGYEVVWTQYFFAPVYLNPGGYREDPSLWVPSYFMNPFVNYSTLPLPPRGDQGSTGQSFDPFATGRDPGANADTETASDGATIFDWLLLYNPQSYSDNGTVNGNLVLSSLREADGVELERTWEKVPHRWKVAPIGKWDIDLCQELGGSGPQVASDFNQNPVDFGDN